MTSFITGGAAADVSAALRKKLMAQVMSGRNVTLIVPDQFEYETEKALYRACADMGSTSSFPLISVRTFSKLSEEIVAAYSGEKKPADDITKNILMYRAVSEIRDSLEAFGKVAMKPGFAPKMTGTVTMLKTAGITAASFCKTIEAVSEDFRDSSPALFSKLSDISRIYTAYDALLSQSYSDRLDLTMTAARLAAEHGYFRGMTVYCDGFSDFSKSQMDFLYSIIDLAKDVTFAFTTDISDGCRDIFTTVNSCISLLAERSEKADIPTDGTDKAADAGCRISCDAIKEVERCIFSDRTTDADMDGVTLMHADDVHDEADYVAAEIRRLITEEGYLCSEIAVLCANTADYRAPLESSFDKFDIPLFCDIPESILHLPLVNLVLALLGVLKSFTVDSVLSYIKTGFIQKSDGKPLTMRDVNDLEDYIYEWDLKSSDLKQPFPDVNGKTPRAEKLRADIIPPLLALKEQLKGCTGDEITKAVCDFLFDTVGIQRAVAAHCKATGSELLSDSDDGLIASYQTLWGTMLGIFEGLFRGLQGYRISLADYCDLVRDICAGTTLAAPPKTLDSVLAGDIARTRTDKVRAVFIIGASYGVFPNEEQSSGVFSEYETELLSESIIKLGMDRKERYCYNRYLAYRAMTAPTERLYITCPLLDSGCGKLSLSEVFTQVLDIFRKDKSALMTTRALGDEFFCRTMRAAQQRYAAICTEDSMRRETLKKALDDAGLADFTAMLDRLCNDRYMRFDHKLDPETAEALFRTKTFSATKLERLNHCRFEYFCANGLRIKERSRRNLSSLEIGNAVHYVLQKVLEKYCARMDAFVTLTRKHLSDEARYYLNEYKNAKLGGDYAKTLRFNYLYKNLTIGAVDMLVLMQSEFAARDYRPKFFELAIGSGTAEAPVDSGGAIDISSVPDAVLHDDAEVTYSGIQESDDTDTNSAGSSRTTLNTPALSVNIRNDLSIDITGIIDRADVFTDEHGNEYIRVVDYKTGSREFNMVNVYYGINTQMLLYLIAVCDANSDISAGGVSYLPAKVTEPVAKRTEAFALLASDHVQSGMYIASDAAAAEMNKYACAMSMMSGVKPDKFMPKPENTLTEQEFEQLTLDMLDQTREVVGKLYDGDVAAVPTVYREKSIEKRACSYCRFDKICGHREDMQVYALPREDDEEKEDSADDMD